MHAWKKREAHTGLGRLGKFRREAGILLDQKENHREKQEWVRGRAGSRKWKERYCWGTAQLSGQQCGVSS